MRLSNICAYKGNFDKHDFLERGHSKQITDPQLEKVQFVQKFKAGSKTNDPLTHRPTDHSPLISWPIHRHSSSYVKIEDHFIYLFIYYLLIYLFINSLFIVDRKHNTIHTIALLIISMLLIDVNFQKITYSKW